jgi:prevent-host-death family protein
MAIHTLSSREFTRDVAAAKRAACDGPVFITDRGAPAHVLLTIEEYERLAATGPNLVQLLAMPGGADIEFDPPEARIELRIPDLED